MQSFYQHLTTLFAPYIVQTGSIPITGISTNTRTLHTGDLFIPLVGDNFNGHNFIIATVLDKVSAIACSEPLNIAIPPHITIFQVPHTLDFYQSIATEFLNTKTCKKIAITGSAGKTSTKEWLALLLEHQYSVYKTKSNLNNLVGVPLSVLEVENQDIAIFELGTGKPKDIEKLVNIIKPDISIVTNVGAAHIEYFGSLENIAQEKASICQIQSQCYTVDENIYKESIFKDFHTVHFKTIFDKIENINEQGFYLNLKGHRFLFPFFGEYNLQNLSLAIKIAMDLGITAQQIANTVFPPLPSYRSLIKPKGQSRLILDCYNANPLSMQASIISLSQFEPLPILILGDMLELGEQSQLFHQQLGNFLNQYNFPCIFFIGKEMQFAVEQYKKPHYCHEDILALQDSIIELFSKNQLIFIKGSRGMNLEQIENW